MNRSARALVILALGLTSLRMVISGAFANFVQTHMRIPLAIASVILLLLGLSECVTLFFWKQDDGESLTKRVAPGVGALLMAPVVVIGLIAPTSLGAVAAGRVDALVPAKRTDPFAPLGADTNGSISMKHSDFLNRALWDENRSLRGRNIRMIGIVVNDASVPDGFRLTRFLVSCCAADGIPMQITLRGVPRRFANDEWVEAIGVWRPPTTADGRYDMTKGIVPIELDVVSVSKLTNPPDSPYESPY